MLAVALSQHRLLCFPERCHALDPLIEGRRPRVRAFSRPAPQSNARSKFTLLRQDDDGPEVRIGQMPCDPLGGVLRAALRGSEGELEDHRPPP